MLKVLSLGSEEQLSEAWDAFGPVKTSDRRQGHWLGLADAQIQAEERWSGGARPAWAQMKKS